MSAISIRAFNGLKPITDPVLLQDGDATTAKNLRLTSGAIVPLRAATQFKALNVAAPQTIWRYGFDTAEANYWFEFAGDVDAINSPVPTDIWARAYWTDGSQPRYGVVDNMISGIGAYPAGSYILGVPKPANTPSVSGTAYSPASATISASDVAALKVGDILQVTVNNGTPVLITLTGTGGVVTADTLTAQLAAITGLDATAAAGAVTVSTESSDPTAAFDIKRKTGTTESYAAADVTYTTLLGPATGTAETTGTTSVGEGAAVATLTVTMLNEFSQGDSLRVRVSGVETFLSISTVNSRVNPYTLAGQLDALGGITAKVESGAVIVVTDATGGSASIEIARQSVTYTEGGYEILVAAFGTGSGSTTTTTPAGGATVTFSGAAITALPVDVRLSITVNGGAPVMVKIGAGSGTVPAAVNATSLRSALSTVPGVTAVVVDGSPQQVKLTTSLTGTTATLLVRQVAPKISDVFSDFKSFDNAVNISAATKETRTYCYTYVTAYEEEGPPSEASPLTTVDPSMSVSLSGLSGAPTGAYNVTKKRIYRSSTVGSVAQFQYVDEIPVAQTTFTDTKTQAELGETLMSENWDPPPAALKGLKVMASGACIGFVNNTIWLSEPNQPHAWPHSYPIELRIVGIGVFRQSAVVLTTGHPYLITGVDPAAMSVERMEFPQACVSKRSIVDNGDGTIYASPDGLVSIGAGGMAVLTEKLMTREQWQTYNPSSIIGAIHDGRYHAHYTKTDNTRGVLIFDFTGQGAVMTEADIAADHAITAFYSDARTDTLYFAQNGYIRRFNNATTGLTATWRSKLFRMPMPLSLGASAVDAESYPTDVPIKVRFYASGELKHERNITSAESFRLPTGFRAQDWQFEIETKVKVTRLRVATTSTELHQV